jgi:hypothetical protein
MTNQYVAETMLRMLASMAASPYPLRARLEHAWDDLSKLKPEDDGLDEETVRKLAELTARCTVVKDEQRGDIRATLATLNEDELFDLARLATEIASDTIIDSL